jgi:hypothetical protein
MFFSFYNCVLETMSDCGAGEIDVRDVIFSFRSKGFWVSESIIVED